MIESPILRPIPSPKRMIVLGTHTTSDLSVNLSVVAAMGRTVEIHTGQLGLVTSQSASPKDLRELAELFTEMADILDGK